jgi:hypothetical protein
MPVRELIYFTYILQRIIKNRQIQEVEARFKASC